MLDFFEMERVIEELAKAYPAQCATTWFKITKNHKPSEEQYRNKVVEYMKIFEYLLATYPSGPDTDRLKQVVKKILAKEIERVLKGDNKDVEKRHKHYVINSPSSSSPSNPSSASAVVVNSNDTLKDVSRQQQLEKAIEITNTSTASTTTSTSNTSIKKRLQNNKSLTVTSKQEEEKEEKEPNQENQYENTNVIIVDHGRKKRIMKKKNKTS